MRRRRPAEAGADAMPTINAIDRTTHLYLDVSAAEIRRSLYSSRTELFSRRLLKEELFIEA